MKKCYSFIIVLLMLNFIGTCYCIFSGSSKEDCKHVDHKVLSDEDRVLITKIKQLSPDLTNDKILKSFFQDGYTPIISKINKLKTQIAVKKTSSKITRENHEQLIESADEEFNRLKAELDQKVRADFSEHLQKHEKEVLSAIISVLDKPLVKTKSEISDIKPFK